LHTGQGFEERGNLRRNLRDVAGKFVAAGGIAIAGGNDGDLVHFAERFAERADHFRKTGDEFVHDRGLVVFLIRLGFHVHGLSFGFALLEDDFRFRFTLRANRSSAAFGFGHEALTFGVSKRLDALTLDLGLLEYGGDEFAFAACDLGILHLDLRLALDLLNPHLLERDRLLLTVGLDFVSLVGLRLGFLAGFEKLRFLDVEVALRFGAVSAATRS
jgi:hypothetical protein